MTSDLSASELAALGERLRSVEPTEDDLRLLDALRRMRSRPLEQVLERLARDLGLPAVSRLKRPMTIIAKLRRQRNLSLDEMQDIAGVRIVCPMTLTEQTALSDRIARSFAECRPKVVDRRAHPSFGYRAIHLIVPVDDGPVEIQLRTTLQHGWALTMERFSLNWGRQIQYGKPPDQATSIVRMQGQREVDSATRQELVEAMQPLSDYITALEALQDMPAGAHVLDLFKGHSTETWPPADGSDEPDTVSEDFDSGPWQRYDAIRGRGEHWLLRLHGVNT